MLTFEQLPGSKVNTPLTLAILYLRMAVGNVREVTTESDSYPDGFRKVRNMKTITIRFRSITDPDHRTLSTIVIVLYAFALLNVALCSVSIYGKSLFYLLLYSIFYVFFLVGS